MRRRLAAAADASHGAYLLLCCGGAPQPVMGPSNPHRVNIVTTTSNTVVNYDAFSFHQQYHEFMNSGGGVDPTDSRLRISAPQALARPLKVADRKKRARGDVRDETYLGPWAGYEGEEEARKSCIEKGLLTAEQQRERKELGLDKDDKDKEKEKGKKEDGGSDDGGDGDGAGGAAAGAGGPSGKAKATATMPDEVGGEEKSESEESDDDGVARGGKRRRGEARTLPSYRAGMSKEDAKSIFHGKQQRDYQGRSWHEPPRGVHPDPDHECFAPKRCIHTFTGHTKGVQVRRRPARRYLAWRGEVGSARVVDASVSAVHVFPSVSVSVHLSRARLSSSGSCVATVWGCRPS